MKQIFEKTDSNDVRMIFVKSNEFIACQVDRKFYPIPIGVGPFAEHKEYKEKYGEWKYYSRINGYLVFSNNMDFVSLFK